MQYAIYIVLAFCLACLAASVVVFYTYERRWQKRIEQDAHAVMLSGRYKALVRADTAFPRQRSDDMQIVADEANPMPYQNAA